VCACVYMCVYISVCIMYVYMCVYVWCVYVCVCLSQERLSAEEDIKTLRDTISRDTSAKTRLDKEINRILKQRVPRSH
jgi:hypothetical protein